MYEYTPDAVLMVLVFEYYGESKTHKHGTKASKRDISSEYLCICTGTQRKGDALAITVNRAKRRAKEL